MSWFKEFWYGFLAEQFEFKLALAQEAACFPL